MLCLAHYSYSEQYIYGQTDNAAAYGSTWNMVNVLPQITGLSINSVIYRYTAFKETSDDMVVHVQNKDNGGGYVFRTTDDWSGKPSGSINRIVPIDNVAASLFGEGSIQVEGQGEVKDPTVIYTYKIEPKSVLPDIPEPEIYNYDDDQAVKDALKETDPDLYDRDNKKTKSLSESKKEKLQKALAASDNALTISGAMTQEAMLQAMQMVNFSPNYAKVLNGGAYNETLSLPTSDIPDSKAGLRNGFAQQLLHQQMVDSQYEN